MQIEAPKIDRPIIWESADATKEEQDAYRAANPLRPLPRCVSCGEVIKHETNKIGESETDSVSGSADVRPGSDGNPEDQTGVEAAHDSNAEAKPKENSEAVVAPSTELATEVAPKAAAATAPEGKTPASVKPPGDQSVEGTPTADPTISVPTAQNISAKELTNPKE